MQRYYSDREAYGPEFDDRLIKLVRKNPAIYDVSHPHYRRNPVRVSIWERIAAELGATSARFIQTKWKNIRYNYLQELKSLETGQINPNVRKRRFTEDLSFLQNTAQTYNVRKSVYKNISYNSSDNDSNSFMYPDLEPPKTGAFEVIEIENSEDGSINDYDMNNTHDDIALANEPMDAGDDKLLAELSPALMQNDNKEPVPDVTIEQKLTIRSASSVNNEHNDHPETSPAYSYRSNNSSPMLMPLVIMGNGNEHHNSSNSNNSNNDTNSNSNTKKKTKTDHATGYRPGTTTVSNNHQQNDQQHNELTIEPIGRTKLKRASEILTNAAKRKSMPAPMPVLTPINDPIELYCLSLVDSLRSMPRSERERVKFEFANILKDAKYKDQT